MLEVNRELVAQWEKERSVQLEEHMRSIAKMVEQIQAELTSKAMSPLRLGALSELGSGSPNAETSNPNPDHYDITPLRPPEGDMLPTEAKQREDIHSSEDLHHRHVFLKRFMQDKVKGTQTRALEELDTETPESSGLAMHLNRVQKQSAKFGKPKRKKSKDRLGAKHVDDEHHTRDVLKRFVDSKAFTGTVAFLIFANTIVTALEVDLNMTRALKEPPQSVEEFWSTINLVFTIMFAVELFLRFVAYRLDLFTSDDVYWNLWDVIVVVSSIVEELVAGIEMSALRALRILRLVRTLRIIRVVRFFRQLRLMVCCILNGIMQLAWALVLLVLLMSLFSIVCVQAAATHLRDKMSAENDPIEAKGDTLTEDALREAFELNYRSIWRASMAMLMSVSGGCDWYEVMAPLLNISYLYAFLFVLFVVFVVFGVLNVLTGIFVEQALQVRDRDLIVQAEMDKIDGFLHDMADIFAEADGDTSGMLTKRELKRFLNQDRVLAYMSTYGLDVSDMSAMFRILDADNTGAIDMEEWLIGCLRLKGQAKCLDVMRLVECVDEMYSMLQDIQKTAGVMKITSTR